MHDAVSSVVKLKSYKSTKKIWKWHQFNISFHLINKLRNNKTTKMNTFLTIMCFALVATATAKPGYNYQQPKPVVKQSFRPSAPVSSSGIYSVQQAPPLTSFNVQSQSQQIKQNFVATAPGPVSAPQYTPQPIDLPAPPAQYAQQQFATPAQLYSPSAPQFTGPAPQYVAPVQQPPVYAPSAPAASSSHYNYQPQQTIVSKDIYIHSAPEETEEIGGDQGVEAGPIRKNYRIVFIKAPSQNLKLNLDALKRAQASNEEKTVIYVLSKKPDLANIQNQLSAVQTEQKAHKPEVYFIKYKTQEEANRAQQEIQAQYDALGGSTHISDEGIAPVTSVIGGGPVNVGSVGPVFGSGSSNVPVFSSGSANGGSFGGSSNFVQSASNNQQTFVQQSFQGSQGSSSTCLALVASAAAKPGYNYQQPKSVVKQSFFPSAPSQSQQIKQNFVGSVPPPQFAPQPIDLSPPQFVAPVQQYSPAAPQFVGPAPQYVAPVQQSAVYAPSAPALSSSQYNYQPQQQTIVSKDIFIHSAPEETEEIGGDLGAEAGPIRKNYRIVFIKAPSQNLKLNLDALKRAQASNEEKTVIYVLSKKPDLANIQNQLSAVQTEQKAHKPEVYFIKYKTQEEANRAQQEIQAQYDALGGSTRISDEGIAPVTSVIGGGPVKVGSVGPVFGSGSNNVPVFSSGSFGGSSNFVQSASNNQQTFVQQSFQGNQGSASTVSFGVEAPHNKYLPAQKK
ncbi:hypothetical protein CVS40_0644 [Lucilia cuprina]|nr:hypothetical protein CVS40_0644 [Lucilia cuprina]